MPIRVIFSMLNHRVPGCGSGGAWRGSYVTGCSSPAAKLKLQNAEGNTNKAANKATRAIVGHHSYASVTELIPTAAMPQQPL